MGISKHPSVVAMPKAERPYPSILAFLSNRFPAISRETSLAADTASERPKLGCPSSTLGGET